MSDGWRTILKRLDAADWAIRREESWGSSPSGLLIAVPFAVWATVSDGLGLTPEDPLWTLGLLAMLASTLALALWHLHRCLASYGSMERSEEDARRMRPGYDLPDWSEYDAPPQEPEASAAETLSERPA